MIVFTLLVCNVTYFLSYFMMFFCSLKIFLGQYNYNCCFSGLSISGGTGTFICLKWSLVPPDLAECCIRYSWKLFKYLLTWKILKALASICPSVRNKVFLMILRVYDWHTLFLYGLMKEWLVYCWILLARLFEKKKSRAIVVTPASASGSVKF